MFQHKIGGSNESTFSHIFQAMEDIKHTTLFVRGLNLHVAEIGSGPAVLLLHGFPEIWYSWRFQMIALAKAGYHAIAPDYRGYGLSDHPSEIEKNTYVDLVEDMAGLLDALGIKQVFVVAKDFGAFVGYHLDLLHPKIVKGIVALGIPYRRVGMSITQRNMSPKGFYTRHWQVPGRPEADFGRFDVRTVVKNIYTLFSRSEVPTAEEGKEIMDLYDPATPLPQWFTEDDLNVYASLYEKSGFQFAMQVPYRCFPRTSEVLSDLSNFVIEAPTLLIMGTKDYVLKFPGMEAYISSDQFKAAVPNLEIMFFPDGSHFVQEQFPEEINKLIVAFLNKHL